MLTRAAGMSGTCAARGRESRSARTGHRAPYGRAEHQAENQGQPSPRDGVHRLKQRCLDEKDAREFLDRSVQWFGARYGYENLLAAQIHLDEGTPHAHIWIAPVIRGEDGHDRLCAKELFAPDKRRKNADGKWEVTAQGTMSRLQEDFWEQVAKPYGYERPLRHELRAKGYRSLDAYKVQVGTTRALKSEIETLEGARDKAKHGAITAKRELDGLEQLRLRPVANWAP